MTDHRPPPPEPEECLTHSRASRYKGGTIIAEDVHDLATHQRRICTPDGYRLDACPRCECRVLHVHDYVERLPRGAPEWPPVIRVVRYICADKSCAATWRILPAFLARHLWRVWPTVETAVAAPIPLTEPKPIAERTAARWRDRLASSARQLVLLLATSGGTLLETIAKLARPDASRRELVTTHAQQTTAPQGRRLADLAALVHRLERGIRLM